VKILHLMSCRGWSSDAYWAARVCHELHRLGHEPILCCRAGTEGGVMARALAEGVPRIEALTFASALRPGRDARDVRRIAARLAGVDVVHAHRGKEHWLAAIANRLTRTPRPLVRTRHIVRPVRPHAGNRWLYRRATARVIAVTEAIRQQYIASGLIGPERVTTLLGGVDTDAYRPDVPAADLRQRLGVPPGVPLVGLVGGLRSMKGHRILLDALRRLRESGQRPPVVLIGQGPLDAPLRDAVRDAGLETQVAFLGFTDKLPTAMAALDVALYVPVESEGMSRVLFEYLASGRAIVASRVGVVPEVLVDGEAALLVSAGDPAALAGVLGRLLLDPSLRARLATNARRLAEARFSSAAVARRLAAIYGALAER
jgi:glycosyltransferase involved in cell wall biosynthesis